MARPRLPNSSAVPAVARAARLLDALAAARAPLTLATLTAGLHLPKSTVHGLCQTLVGAGLVTRFENGTYHLGLRVMDLAHAFVARTDLTIEFARVWDELSPLPEETIILSVLDGADVVYVACRNGSQPLGVNFRIGMRLPANCTASGKALLSTLPPERVEALMRSAGMRGLTRHSVNRIGTLLKQLAETRVRGYSLDDEETRDGMVCFGAPVYDSRGGEAAAAVAVSMLKASLDRRRGALASHAVVETAAALSRRLGASLPPTPR